MVLIGNLTPMGMSDHVHSSRETQTPTSVSDHVWPSSGFEVTNTNGDTNTNGGARACVAVTEDMNTNGGERPCAVLTETRTPTGMRDHVGPRREHVRPSPGTGTRTGVSDHAALTGNSNTNESERQCGPH